MTGLHIVPKTVKTGKRWYIYAWRGGPLIRKVDGPKPAITRDLLDEQYRAKQEAFGRQTEDIDWLIDGYKLSQNFTKRAHNTRRDYKLWLDRISARFGTTPVEVFDDWRMRGDVIEWRDNWAHQPRTADKAVVMMTTLLNWGVENGKLRQHQCHNIELLHHADKSHEIWEDRHWKAVESQKGFPAHMMTALRLASLTGLRLGDLVALEWSQVFPNSIVIEKTQKRGTRATIPIIPELRKLLKEIGRKDGPVLLNSRGSGWTANGIGTIWQRNKPEGFDRTIHDLRGTYATTLMMRGVTDQDIAEVLGWKTKDVAQIRRRYVDSERVVISISERFSA